MVRSQEPGLESQPLRRPGVGAPRPRNILRLGSRRVAVLQIEDHARIALHTVIDSFQPVIEPAHCLIAPFDSRSIDARVGSVVIPRPYPGVHGCRHALEHTRDAVAIAVLKSADEETRYRNVLQTPDRRSPESAIALMTEVIE